MMIKGDSKRLISRGISMQFLSKSVHCKSIFTSALLATTIALSGCVGTGIKEGNTTEETAHSYEEFKNSQPSFAVQSVNDPATDTILEAVAGYAENSYNAFVALDAITSQNLDGYKVHMQLSELDNSARASYQEKLTAQDMTSYRKYVQEASDITEAQSAQRGELLKATLGVMQFDKDQLLGNAGMMEKIQLARALSTATEQARYAQQASSWFKRQNAMLVNATNDLGR